MDHFYLHIHGKTISAKIIYIGKPAYTCVDEDGYPLYDSSWTLSHRIKMPRGEYTLKEILKALRDEYESHNESIYDCSGKLCSTWSTVGSKRINKREWLIMSYNYLDL